MPCWGFACAPASGCPLGDYYYALANSDGWLHEVTDPKAITELFEQAAAKGSMDAKILLAFGIDPREVGRQRQADKASAERAAAAQVLTAGDVWPVYLAQGKPKRRDAWKPGYRADLEAMAAQVPGWWSGAVQLNNRTASVYLRG